MRTVPRNALRRTALILALAVLLPLTSFAVAAPILQPPSLGLADALLHPTTLHPVSDALGQGGLSAVTASDIAQAVSLTTDGKLGNVPLSAYAPLEDYLAHPQAYVPGLLVLDGVSGGAVIGIACAVTSVVGCAVAIVGVAVTLGILYWLGEENAQDVAIGNAQHLANLIVSQMGYSYNVQETAMSNELQALNLTEVALEYEASSAALDQLGNLTWNGDLDAAQSGIASQFATVFQADALTLSSISLEGMATFNAEEGSGNSIGAFCPLDFNVAGEIFDGIPSGNSGGATACGSSPSSFDLAAGNVTGSWEGMYVGADQTDSGTGVSPSSSTFCASNSGSHDSNSCASFYLPHDTDYSIFISSGSTFDSSPVQISFIPVSKVNGPWINTTVTGDVINATFNGASGGYYIGSDGSAYPDVVQFFPQDSFPLDYAGVNQDTTYTNSTGYASGPAVFYNPETGASGATCSFVPIEDPFGADLCYHPSGGGPTNFISAGTTGYAAAPYGGNTNATMSTTSYNSMTTFLTTTFTKQGAQYNLGRFLDILEQNAVHIGETYWAFLHALGYYNLSQVPADCIIPTPGQLFPPTFPPSELEDMNLTQLLNLYYAELYALGLDFNATNGLNAFNFCGHHIIWDPWNTTLGFGTVAYGYIFFPGAPYHYPGGSSVQNWSKPKTWEAGGVFYMAPSIANYTIPTNVTWTLGYHNAAQFFISPFITNEMNGSLGDNQTGPSWCAVHGGVFGSSKVGCQSGLTISVSGLVNGNSTLQGGSLYPNSLTASAESNVSVYITACFYALPTSSSLNPVYLNAGGSCRFDLSTINNTGWECGSSIQGSGFCIPPIGPILTGGSGSCGESGWLGTILGSIANPIESIPIIGAYACDIAWVVFVIVVVVVLVIVVDIARYALPKRN